MYGSNPFAEPYKNLRNLNETLTSSSTASDYIHDFVHSKDKTFAGDSKKERIRRALGAYYAKKSQQAEAVSLTARKADEDEISKGSDGSAKINPKNVKNVIEINPTLRPIKSGNGESTMKENFSKKL